METRTVHFMRPFLSDISALRESAQGVCRGQLVFTKGEKGNGVKSRKRIAGKKSRWRNVKANSPSAGGVGSARGNTYQKKVAAWWLTRVLTQNTMIGAAFGLSSGLLPVRIVGQTEDPVDDFRIEFSDDSRIFLQCKQSVSLSQNPASEFGKAWTQFCHQVTRATNSAHPIRCILCYESPNTALSKLHEVFRRARQESEWTKLMSYARTQAEKAAAKVLSRLHTKLQAKDRRLPTLRNLVSAVHFHRLEVADLGDSRVQSTEALQNGILSNLGETRLAVETLDTLGEELTATRGLSFDIAATRLRLRKAGVHLKDVPELDPDLRELDAESKRTLEAFHEYHRDQLGNRFTLDRPVVGEVVARAANGPLLVIGEPGAGKTGVLMALAHKLKASGRRVWFLLVDGYEAKSLPSLEKELNLRHRLTDILGFAAEDDRTVLMLDGLDAAREGVKQSTWRTLVREAHRRGVPVIATIRLFDLRNSQPWQQLFPLSSSEPESNAVSGLNQVRFINVGELSDAELSQGLAEFPKVRELAESQPAIRILAKNIFNFSLLCQLAESGMPHNPVHTQLELLEAWWKKRVDEAGGLQTEATLTTVVKRMVLARKLQASAGGLGTKSLSDAQSVGLIRAVLSRPGYMADDSVEFTHNVLFDYAAFHCFVLPKRDEFISELATPESWGLFLRPSLGHFFTWFWDKFRDEFWQRAFAFQSASIPTLHKTAMWFAIARSARHRDDFVPILNGIGANDTASEIWLSLARGVNGCAEAAVWKQLFRRSDGLWWVEYSCDLLRSGNRSATGLGWQILYVVFYEVEHFKAEAYPLINQAARLEVETHWPIAVPFGPGIKASIWLFCRTICGNPEESAKLIRRMLTPEELAASGYFRGNQVADQIVPIARCLPDLAIEVYAQLYSYRELSAEQVPMGDSVVMAMQTSRHDMYGSCHHNLEKGLPPIFGFNPGIATRCVSRALDGERKSGGDERATIVFRFNTADVQTVDLLAYSEYLDSPHNEKARLLAAWRECLRNLPTNAECRKHWKEVADVLVGDTSPDMWAALLSAACHQPAFFSEAIWPMFYSSELLCCWHFKEYIDPCIEALANHIAPSILHGWQDVVLALRSKDLARQNYRDNPDALEKLKSSYLLRLPKDALTKEAQKFLIECKPENIKKFIAAQPRKLAKDEILIMERRRNGLDPENPLHIRLEQDLADLMPKEGKKIGFEILEQIREIETRFRKADAEVQSRLRGQFQNGFSWALRGLAAKASRLTPKQFQRLLRLCEELLDTSSGRDNAFEAIGLALANKRKLTKSHCNLLRRVTKRSEPKMVERFGHYIWAFLDTWPEFVWQNLELWTERMSEAEIAKALRYTLHDSWFWWLFHADDRRALKLLEQMLNNARQTKNIELADGFLAWFTAVAIDKNIPRSREIVETALSQPELYGIELAGTIHVLTDWVVPREPRSEPSPLKVERAFALVALFFNASQQALERWRREQNALPQDQRGKEQPKWITTIAHAFDRFASELRFSSENHSKTFQTENTEDFKRTADAWWSGAEPILAHFENWLHPHSGDHLIDALDDWLPHYPTRCLQWLRKLCAAGERTGLLFERFVVSKVIKILQNCLVEHRDLLGSDKAFLQDFAAVLEALLNTANAEALGMAASLDEFYR